MEKNHKHILIPDKRSHFRRLESEGVISKEEYYAASRLLCKGYEVEEITKELLKKEVKEFNEDFKKSSKHKRRVTLKTIALTIIIVVCVTIILFATFYSLSDVFKNIVKLINIIGDGNWIKGVIILPFAFWGAVQIFRGFCEMCDTRKIDSTISLLSSIIGFFALFYVLSKL